MKYPLDKTQDYHRCWAAHQKNSALILLMVEDYFQQKSHPVLPLLIGDSVMLSLCHMSFQDLKFLRNFSYN